MGSSIISGSSLLSTNLIECNTIKYSMISNTNDTKVKTSVHTPTHTNNIECRYSEVAHKTNNKSSGGLLYNVLSKKQKNTSHRSKLLSTKPCRGNFTH